ncbi:hypothetical protein Celaphus_00015585, partial [Cervus elaphus hippelaphus]
ESGSDLGGKRPGLRSQGAGLGLPLPHGRSRDSGPTWKNTPAGVSRCSRRKQSGFLCRGPGLQPTAVYSTRVPQWGLGSQVEPQTPTDVRETVDRLPSPAVAAGCRSCLRPALSPPGSSLPLGAKSRLPTWSES